MRPAFPPPSPQPHYQLLPKHTTLHLYISHEYRDTFASRNLFEPIAQRAKKADRGTSPARNHFTSTERALRYTAPGGRGVHCVR